MIKGSSKPAPGQELLVGHEVIVSGMPSFVETIDPSFRIYRYNTENPTTMDREHLLGIVTISNKLLTFEKDKCQFRIVFNFLGCEIRVTFRDYCGKETKLQIRMESSFY